MDRRQILVVEDDRTTCRLLAAIFAHLGWEVLIAPTVAEALASLDPPPDRILLALSLPDGDGAEVLRHVRSARLPTRVVVTTGYEPTSREAVRAWGPDAFLQKP